MKILLTGATGFLGSHLAQAFVEDGHQVISLKRFSSSLDRLGDVKTEIQFYDVEDLSVARPFKENPTIETVIHTATCYGRAGESPVEIFRANTEFPLHLLTTALQFKTDTFFNTDTILSAYLNAYALSKKHFVDWGRILCEGSSTRFLNIRLEHMYGPLDDSSKFTTWIVEQCLKNTPEIALTEGEQKRDFIYINDVVNAYRTLLESASGFQRGFTQVGLGSGQPISLRRFIQTVHRLTESTSQLNYGALAYRQNEQMHSRADLSTLKNLGWAPSYSLDKGLKQVIKSAKQQLITHSI